MPRPKANKHTEKVKGLRNAGKKTVKMPRKAMLLAAGLGARLRPITKRTPKPLVRVLARTLIDRSIDRLDEAGVESVVVNLHHLKQQVERHLRRRHSPEILFSEEKDLLDTGGGVAKALPILGREPFFVINGDIMWLDGPKGALERMAAAWDDRRMDALLLLHFTVEAYGYTGPGDFVADAEGRIARRPENEVSPYLFTGIQLLHPRLFRGAPADRFSLNVLYDMAIEKERLYGIVHDGEWFHIGTPEGLAEAEEYMHDRYPLTKHR